jgi:Monooxygenase af470-like
MASTAIERRTVDLAAYPQLVVIYLGMRVNRFRGLGTLLKFGPRISAAVAAKPDGLLRHEPIIYSIFPPHFGMRQYWRDFESLEGWARSLPHQDWWRDFLRDSGGTGFWHEAYFKRGGMEAVYDNIPSPLGFSGFAGMIPAKGAMFSARRRAGVAGESSAPPAVRESELEAGDITSQGEEA